MDLTIHHRINLLIYLCCIIITGCRCHSDRGDESNSISAIQPDTIEINTSLPGLELTSLVEIMRLVALESKEEALIGRMDKIIASDSVIVILDKMFSKDVFAFDWNGNFLYKISNIGDGPGEYVDVFDIDISGPYLYLSDRGRKIIRFDKYTGKFIEEYPFTNWTGTDFVVSHTDNRAIFCRNFGHDDAVEAQLVKCLIFSAQLSDTDYTCLFPYEDYFKNETYSPRVIFPRNGDQLLIAPPYSYQIYRYKDRQTEPFIYLDFGDRAFDLDLLKAEYKSTASVFDYLQGNAIIHHIFRFAFSDRFVFATYSVNRTAYSFVVDMNTNQTLMGGNSFHSSFEYGFNLSMPRAACEEWFVSVLEPDWLLFNTMDDHRFQDLLRKNGMGDIDKNDNPLLVFFKVDEDGRELE